MIFHNSVAVMSLASSLVRCRNSDVEMIWDHNDLVVLILFPWLHLLTGSRYVGTCGKLIWFKQIEVSATSLH